MSFQNFHKIFSIKRFSICCMQTDRKHDRCNVEKSGNFCLSTHQRRWIRDSSVDVVIRIPAEQASNRGSKPGSGKIIFFSGTSANEMGSFQPSACYVQRVVYVTGAED
jgi:hypothetical protein